MHTLTRPSTTDTIAARWLVELEDLMCPGCGEQVRGAPPAGLDGHEGGGGLEVELFSHLDATALCRTRSGAVAEPVETVR